MKFTINEKSISCNQCGRRFLAPLPQNREFIIECPNCKTSATYWIEWYVSEIEEEEELVY